MSYHAGIDPGFTGAIAILDELGRVVEVFDTPTKVQDFRKAGKMKTRPVMDCAGMVAILKTYTLEEVILEEVNARPGQGVVSMFRFGQGLGTWQGVLGALEIPVRYSLPAAWKEYFDFNKKGKDAPLLAAREYFKDVGKTLRYKKHHNRADALYLAEYGRLTNGAAS